MAKRTRCKSKGCRKLSVEGSPFCKAHAPVYAIDHVLRMTDIERLSAARADAELANLMLSIKNHDLEIEKFTMQYMKKIEEQKLKRVQLMAAFELKRAEQKRTFTTIAEKYGLVPDKMTYDPDTGILRDLRQEKEQQA